MGCDCATVDSEEMVAASPMGSTASPRLGAEQRLHLLLDAACDFAIFFLTPAGLISEWSCGAERLLGLGKEDALGRDGRMIFTPEDRARGVPELEMRTAAATGQANDERWHVRADGERILVAGRMVALRDERGTLYGFAKILRDVTARVRMELALQASDELFRATFAQAPVGMALLDLDGRIRRTNAAFRRLLDDPAPSPDGRPFVELVAPEHRGAVAELHARLARGEDDGTGRPVVEKQLQRADGSRVWVRTSAALLRDAEGRPLSLIDLCEDISAQRLSAEELAGLVERRTGELLEQAKQLEAFCHTISHDLRAPLRAISGYAEFLREDHGHLLPEAGRESIRRIEASAARLDRLIGDLLGYTRLRQGPVVREEVDLDAVLERVVWNVRREQPVPGLSLEVRAPLGRVRAHDVTMEHVFQNLLSNAVKFRRPDEAPRVVVRAERSGAKGALRVWVEDNGLGVESRSRERIFGMFERLHPERKIEGTGVGLAIVATIIERLGGGRGVEPNTPRGSRFWVEFPPDAVIAEAGGSGDEVATEPPASPAG